MPIRCSGIQANALQPWNPDPSGDVLDIAPAGSTVYLAGYFDFLGAVARDHVAAVDATSGSVAGWAPWLGSPGALSVAVAGGTVAVGGDFAIAGGVDRRNLAALDGLDGGATNWAPESNGGVRALLVDGPDLVVGGGFAGADSIGGATRSGLAKVDLATGAASPWNPAPNGSVYALATSGRTLFFGGAIYGVGGAARLNAAAVDLDTGDLTPWDPRPADGEVYGLLISGSTVFLGGNFDSLKTPFAVVRTGQAAVTAAAGDVLPWDPAPPDANALVRSGQTVFVAASFGLYPVDATTGAATPPDTQVDDTVRGLALDGSTLYVGGDFTHAGGQPRNGLAALDVATGLATSWHPTAPGRFGVALGGGGVVALGRFASYSEPPASTAAPILAGTPVQDQALTCTLGTWSGSVPQAYATSWLRDGTAIAGASAATYAATGADVGHAVGCRVLARNLGGRASADSGSLTIALAPPGGPDGPGSPGGPGGTGPDRTRPVISAVRLSPRFFRARPRGASVAAAARGAVVTYRLSEAALVTFAVQRPTPGRRRGKRCVKATPKLRHRARCTRMVVVRGSFARRRPVGADRLRFTGRLGHRTLPARAYRLRLVAVDAAGNRSAPVSTAFAVKHG